LRGGICRTPFGRVLYGEVEHDSDDPVAKVLLAAGCRHVLSTDRGSRHPAELNLRAGADDDGSRRETSQLFALSRPARPHAFVWGRPAGG
jgi:hypothetical protein